MKWAQGFLAGVIIFFQVVSYAAPIRGTQQLIAEINRIIRPIENNAVIGITVKSMKHGDSLYIRNDQKSLIPASISKLLTAEAALLFLGPDYHFRTSFLTDGIIQNGVVQGNVYLVQSGDPTLTYNDLVDLMMTLKAQRIHSISGNVYIDNSAYDQVPFGPGWVWNDTRSCYGAPISASIINHNCLSFTMAPAKVAGQYASLVGKSRNYEGVIENTVVTQSSRARCSLRVGKSEDRAVAVSGCMKKGHAAQDITTVIDDVMQYNQSLLQTLLRRFDIKVKGEVLAGKAPKSAHLIAVHDSKSLQSLLHDMLKKSDNIIAGSLFKKMGELFTKQPGSWENGSYAVLRILNLKLHNDLSGIHLVDGSGLSSDNRMKAADLLRVLDYGYHDENINYEFISAFPVAGIDGTLKHRLGNVARKVRAKTGTITGVVSLAGYVVTRDKETLAFVIMINGRGGNAWKYRMVEDKIVTALANYQR